MTRRRTLAAALLALFVAGAGAPALADAPADVTTERACVFLGSDPADRQGVCVNFPWPV